MRAFLIAVLLLCVKPALAECTPIVLPTADIYRGVYGAPDEFKARTCGGGRDEYGDKIDTWACLIWSYAGKGTIVFSRVANAAGAEHMVYGCGTSAPRVVRLERTLWMLDSCRDGTTMKTTPCNKLGLALSEQAWESPPDVNADGLLAFAEWQDRLPRVCSTKAEARALAATCRRSAERSESTDKASVMDDEL